MQRCNYFREKKIFFIFFVIHFFVVVSVFEHIKKKVSTTIDQVVFAERSDEIEQIVPFRELSQKRPSRQRIKYKKNIHAIHEYFEALVNKIDIYTEEKLAEEKQPKKIEYYEKRRQDALEILNQIESDIIEYWKSTRPQELNKYLGLDVNDDNMDTVYQHLFSDKFCFIVQDILNNDRKYWRLNQKFDYFIVISDIHLNESEIGFIQ